ncbi:MAG: PAS domain-containing protein [Armatimonadetes bacterium]|nr:PAS domain-containing protein [Armatimonadota bacterium]
MPDTIVPPDNNEDGVQAPESPQGLRRELDRYRLVVEELQRRIRNLEQDLETATTMAEVPAVVVTRPELRDTLMRLVNKVAMIVQTEKVMIMLHQPDSGTLSVLPPALGISEEQAAEVNISIDEGVSGMVFRTREPILYNDALNDPRTNKDLVSLLHIRNGICVPLVIKQRDEEERLVDERVIGVMHVFNKRFNQDLGMEDVRLVEMLAEQAAAVISNAQLYIQLTEEKEELEEAFEHIAVGVIVVTMQGKVRLINPAACNMLRRPPSDYAGKDLEEVVPPGPVRDLLEEVINNAEERSVEIELGDDDPHTYQAQASLIRSENGGVEAAVAIFNDITDIRRVERMKTVFVSTVSHELRTPLTSIKGFISTLLEDEEGMYDEETRREFLIIINEECDRLTRLISDLLNISRIEAGHGLELQLEDVDLRQVVNRVAANQQAYTKKHEIVTEFDDSVTEIRADVDKLMQILDNLVGNAVKYSPNGGMVKISVSDEGDSVRIDVSDEGLGIPERHRDQIFQRFHQVDDDVDHRSISGTGIGLYLVQHLAQAHGGNVWLEKTEVGVGSTFSLRLPKDPEGALEALATGSE